MVEVMAEYGLVTNNVDKLLKKYPHLESKDKEFVMMYWMECDRVTELGSEFLEKATSSETITRMKRRLLSKKECTN